MNNHMYSVCRTRASCILTAFLLLFSLTLPCNAVQKNIMPTAQPETNDFDALSEVIFVGDSTTYHAVSRGILPPNQVWCPSNHTLMLSSEITSLKILDTVTNTEMTIAEAAAQYKPRYMLFTIGLNGAHTFTESFYKGAYKKLLSAVRTASPNTTLLIQSVFPVAENETAWTSLSPRELNLCIDRLNVWAEDLSADYENCRYLNTASILRDSHGYLKGAYESGDGIHLTAEGYHAIISYIASSAFGSHAPFGKEGYSE